jgi:hypothetical protein
MNRFHSLKFVTKCHSKSILKLFLLRLKKKNSSSKTFGVVNYSRSFFNAFLSTALCILTLFSMCDSPCLIFCPFRPEGKVKCLSTPSYVCTTLISPLRMLLHSRLTLPTFLFICHVYLMKILLFSLISWERNSQASAGSANQPSQKDDRKGKPQSSAGSANQPSQKNNRRENPQSANQPSKQNRERQRPEPKPESRAPPVTLSAQPPTNNTVCSQKRFTLCVKRPDRILLRCRAWCQNKVQV